MAAVLACGPEAVRSHESAAALWEIRTERGLEIHVTVPAQQARDRLRDQTHAAAGLTPLRFTHSQLKFEATRVAKTLNAVARTL